MRNISIPYIGGKIYLASNMIAIPIPSESYAATLLVQRTNNNLIYTDSEIIEYGPLPFFLAGWMTCEIGNSVYYILLLACVILTA